MVSEQDIKLNIQVLDVPKYMGSGTLVCAAMLSV